jgi:hypothetical protein
MYSAVGARCVSHAREGAAGLRVSRFYGDAREGSANRCRSFHTQSPNTNARHAPSIVHVCANSLALISDAWLAKIGGSKSRSTQKCRKKKKTFGLTDPSFLPILTSPWHATSRRATPGLCLCLIVSHSLMRHQPLRRVGYHASTPVEFGPNEPATGATTSRRTPRQLAPLRRTYLHKLF